MTTATPLRSASAAPDGDALDALADEVARLELLRRLGAGAAHTLNNAFTAVLGEALCLLDERKGDPLVAEACQLIQGEIERCARLTRSVALRVQRRDALLDEADLVGLLRSVEPLLRETMSRSIAIECAAPDAPLYVRGAAEDLEQLALLCAHRLVADVHTGGVLRVSAAAGTDGAPRLTLAFRAPQAPRAAGDTGGWGDLVARSMRVIASRHGVGLHEEAGDDARTLVLRFSPALLEG